MVNEVNDDITVEDMLKADKEIKSKNSQVKKSPVQLPAVTKLPEVPIKPNVAEPPKPINPVPISSTPAVIKPVNNKPKPAPLKKPEPVAKSEPIRPLPDYNSRVKKTSKNLLIVLGILLVVLLIVAISVGIYFYSEVLSSDVPESAEGDTIVVEGSGQVNDSTGVDLVSVVSSDVIDSFSLDPNYNLSTEIVTQIEDYSSLFEYCGVSSSTSSSADGNDQTLVCISKKILDGCSSSFMIYGVDNDSLELYEVFTDSNGGCVVQTMRLDGSPEFISVSDFEWSVNGSSSEFSEDVLAKVPLEIYANV